MEYEWDEAKRQATIRARGLDFANVQDFEWDLAMLREDYTRDEMRAQAIGPMHGKLVVVVYTLRDDICRIISLRLATPSERRRYARSTF
jgi:hypothetical protein